MTPGKVILLIVLAVLLELNFQYYDYKGTGPMSPFRDVYRFLPGGVPAVLRSAGQWWGRLVHARTPVTLLPDHVMLCVPKEIEWENPEPGSPEAIFKADVEMIVRGVARRHAKPGITFDENEYYFRGSGWTAYADREFLDVYRAGQRHPLPVDLKEYLAVGSNLICGNTTGHKNGPERYRAYAYTFEGEALKAD